MRNKRLIIEVKYILQISTNIPLNQQNTSTIYQMYLETILKSNLPEIKMSFDIPLLKNISPFIKV